MYNTISKRLYKNTKEIENTLLFHLNYAIQNGFFILLLSSRICKKMNTDYVGKRQEVLKNMHNQM